MSSAPPDPSLHSRRSGPTRRLLGVLAVALAIRVLLIVTTASLGPRIADERDYLQIARSLAEGRGFAFDSGPTSLRPPLYPAFIAALWLGSGTESLPLVRVAQVILALLTAWLVYRLGTDLYDECTGVAAAAITALYPVLIFQNMMALTETLFTLLVIASALALVRLVRAPSVARSLLAGALVGCAALTRSVFWPFPFVLAPLVGWWTPSPLHRRISIAVSLLAGSVLVMAPWAVRNTRLQGVPVVVDTMGGLNLRMGNYEYTPHDRIWDAIGMQGEKSWIVGLPPAPPGGGVWTEGKKERWARGEALRFMLANPGLTLWRACIKFADFWGLDRDFLAGVQKGLFHPAPWFTLLAGIALLVAYPAVLAGALAGIWLAPPADRRAHLLLVLIVVFVCALHSVVFGHPRYRLPVMPVLAIYAGAALTRLDRRQITDVRRVWPVVTCLTFMVAIWVVQFFTRDAVFLWRLLGRTAA
jgi:4-amino-4-deoxy-L-arabinose transferase-like glycosyltransferase